MIRLIRVGIDITLKGLVIKYGGPNSHMAIRCAEYNTLCPRLGDSDELLEFKLLNINFEDEIISGE